MDVDSTNIFAGVMVTGLWLVSIVVLLVLFGVRQTLVMNLAWVICMLIQVVVLAGAVLEGLFLVGVISTMIFVAGLFVYYNWRRQKQL